ncbi:MAG: adenine deaminase [Erysipelotrichaceae bacterium]|nr:adenine deaminase [Erysipelotrichaceae bacterium]
MFVQIQDMMLKKEIIDYIIDNDLYEYFSFVTDDTFPDVLVNSGHLDNIIRKAIRLGMKPEYAIYCATYTPAVRMNFRDRGVIAPGKLADFLIIDDPVELNILSTFKKGKKVYDCTEGIIKSEYSLGKEFENTIKLAVPDLSKFKVHVPGNDRYVNVRAMVVDRNTNVTREKFVTMKVRDNELQWQETDCRLVMVFERHGINGNISYGFASGDCLKVGAVASSLNHDSHDLIVMGANKEDMHKAVKAVIDMNGGIVSVLNGKITGALALPVAGLMTNRTVKETAEDFIRIRKAFEDQGYVHRNTVMNLCLLSLTCVPYLKLTDKGYLNTQDIIPVSLYEEI